MVGLHTEQHLLERSEQAAVILTVFPTKADYPAGHIVACKFCFVELFNLTCFHSQLIKINNGCISHQMAYNSSGISG